MRQTPLTDTKGFVEIADRKADQQAWAASLKALKTDLQSIDKSIAKLAQQDPELKRLFERVTSVIGISQTAAAEIIVATNEFNAISDPKKFACYAGLVPLNGVRASEEANRRSVTWPIKMLSHCYT